MALFFNLFISEKYHEKGFFFLDVKQNMKNKKQRQRFLRNGKIPTSQIL